jgi:uncharacterized protein
MTNRIIKSVQLSVITIYMVLVTPPVSAQDVERFRGPPVLTVSATAQVSIQPDQAIVRLGVLAESAEAADAQNGVNDVMQQILAAMRALGLPDRTLRTEELSLYPIYGNQRPVSDRGEPQEPRIVGYRASNVVSVEVAELARIGEVIDAGIGAGANQLQGISFRARNDAGARAEAMRLAVEEARIQADAVAEALGVRIVGVREVVAGGYDVRPPMPYAGARLATAEMAATPVEPGQVDITAAVTVTYEIGAAEAVTRD